MILAAACMASAGLVHAAAAGAHNDDYTLATMFAIAAVVQLGWAAVAMSKPTRAVLALGALIAFGAVGFWAVAKIWGIGLLDGLVGPQPAQFQDSAATVLELIAGMSAVRALWHPVTNGRRTVLVTRLAVVLGALALVAAVPASASPHSHDHGDGVADGHDHGEAHEDDQGGDHAEVVIEGFGYHADITEDQRIAAQQLVDDTKAALAETDYWDYDGAIAAGYVSIGDQSTGFEHLIHIGHMASKEILDPAAIESLVYRVQPNGIRVLASAMYLMPFGSTMDDVPDIAGDATPWHDHQNLCWDEQNPARVVGILDAEGKCPRGVFRATQPMLHVWVEDNRCGPFAGIEGSHGEGCDHEH